MAVSVFVLLTPYVLLDFASFETYFSAQVAQLERGRGGDLGRGWWHYLRFSLAVNGGWLALVLLGLGAGVLYAFAGSTVDVSHTQFTRCLAVSTVLSLDPTFASASAIGSTMVPLMKDKGYPLDYSVNVTVTAAIVGLLIPPSHNMIIYSAASGIGVSIGDLFMAGVLPGLLTGAMLMMTAWLVARRRNLPKGYFPGWLALTFRTAASSNTRLRSVAKLGPAETLRARTCCAEAIAASAPKWKPGAWSTPRSPSRRQPPEPTSSAARLPQWSPRILRACCPTR